MSADTNKLCTLAKSLLTTALELLSVPSSSTLKNTAVVPAAICWKALIATASALVFSSEASALLRARCVLLRSSSAAASVAMRTRMALPLRPSMLSDIPVMDRSLERFRRNVGHMVARPTALHRRNALLQSELFHPWQKVGG
jgi:hypothetical protein